MSNNKINFTKEHNPMLRTVTVASYEELNSSHYVDCLREAMRDLNIPRRKWPDVIANAIYTFSGCIYSPGGRIYPIPDIDSVIGSDRNISNFMELVNGKPKRQVRRLEPVRLFDLYFRIVHPESYPLVKILPSKDEVLDAKEGK